MAKAAMYIFCNIVGILLTVSCIVLQTVMPRIFCLLCVCMCVWCSVVHVLDCMAAAVVLTGIHAGYLLYHNSPYVFTD